MLEKKLEVILLVGKLLLQHGAETEVVDIGIKRTAQKLGFQAIEVLVLPNTIMISLTHDNQMLTKLQRAERQDINFTTIDRIESIIAKITPDKEIEQLLLELTDEQNTNTMYPFYLRGLMAGLGCASFSGLFGGDFFILTVTFISAYIGFSLNTFLLKKFFNPFLVIVAVSFTTTMISGLLAVNTQEANIAISSSILFLVPSVAFINSVNDLIKRHYTNGITRGIRGVIISFAIAIGMFIALNLLGIERFL